MKLQWIGMCVAAAAMALCGASHGADFTIDKMHSAVLFKVKHLGASYSYGQFTDFSGTISFDLAAPETSKVEVTIKAESVDTNNVARDTHLRNTDFFNVKEFPTLSFKSTAWKKTGERSYDVTGDLTMAGKTKSITATVEHVGDGKNQQGKSLSGFHTVFTVDRTEFGMSYGSPDAIGKDVQITISVEAIKK